MGAIKLFIVSVARILAIIIVATSALSVLSFGSVTLWNNWTESQKIARNAPLEAVKEWPPIVVEAFEGVELKLSTKWIGGQLFYQFRVDGYTSAIAAAREDGNADTVWSLKFIDADGFRAADINVPVSTMTKIVSTPGMFVGLSSNSDAFMSAEEYRHIANWSIQWSGFPKPKPPKPKLKPPELKLLQQTTRRLCGGNFAGCHAPQLTDAINRGHPLDETGQLTGINRGHPLDETGQLTEN